MEQSSDNDDSIAGSKKKRNQQRGHHCHPKGHVKKGKSKYSHAEEVVTMCKKGKMKAVPTSEESGSSQASEEEAEDN
jgi:hypothetical protein